jgi:exonuclease, DNA polymerase III, epsilon subunit family
MENLNFVAIDFETASSERSSICEIGISFVENGKITNSRSWLVKPENNEYDEFNTWIHGITPNDTKDSPEFKLVWREILPLLNEKIVVAHNAAFDMCVLKDALDLYELEYPNIKTFCTYRMSKNIFSGFGSYNLHSICYDLEIPLENHHRAECDAKASAAICIKCFEEGRINDFEQLTEKYRMIPGIMNHADRSYTGPFMKRKDREKLDARLISGDESKNNPDSLFYDQYVVFTGTLSSMERKSAMQIIADIGGFPENGITKKTNFLIVGQQSFSIVGKDGLSGKQKKAYQLLQSGQKIEIMSEDDFVKNI